MEFFRRLFNLLRHLGEDASWQSMIDYVEDRCTAVEVRLRGARPAA